MNKKNRIYSCFKKTLVFLLLMSLGFSNLNPVYAQLPEVVSPSPVSNILEPTPTPPSTNTQQNTPVEPTIIPATPDLTPYLTPPPTPALETPETYDFDGTIPLPETVLNTPQSPLPGSAKFKPGRYVKSLTKRNFQAKEQVQIVVKNTQEENSLTVVVEGSTDPFAVNKTTVNGETSFTITPPASLTPGKYTIKVIDTDTNQILSTQDFTWGVLAINTNKSIYLPGEEANIAIAVLNEAGNMECFAQVELEIISPSGSKTVLSTIDGSIIVNPECLMHAYTLNPDYETQYITQGSGRYFLKLTANTPNGTYTIHDRFEVRNEVPFDVERVTATRVYPPETYPVEIKIKAHESFSGKIVETVPVAFQISTVDDPAILPYHQENAVQESLSLITASGIPQLALPFEGVFPVSQEFGQHIHDSEHRSVYKKSGLDGHDGIDFALPQGTPILSVDEGKVILAQENWIYGTSIVIEHQWGRSYYGHLSSLSVEAGEQVAKGTEIGLSGSTGLSTGPHLHFGIKPKEHDIANLYFGKVDPAPYLGIANVDEDVSLAMYPRESKALVWNVEIEKGAEFTIGYRYKAPLKSPDYYTLGPLKFISSQERTLDPAKFDVTINPFVLGAASSSATLIASASSELLNTVSPTPQENESEERIIFEEIRPWQLAIDAATTVVLDSNADGTCGSGCWTVPADWTDVNTIYAIGGGGAGDNLGTGGGGGGGGAFASISNLDLTAGNNITFGIGSGGTDAVNGGPSWFNAANAGACVSSATCVKGAGGTTATNATGGAGGSIAGTDSVGTTRFAGGTGGTGDATGDDSTGGGGGAGSPNGTGGTGGAGDSSNTGDEAMGGGGGAGCDSIGASNDGTAGGVNGGAGGNSCFTNGGTGGTSGVGNPGSNGSGGGGGDTGQSGGLGGDGVGASDPSLAGGGGGGGDDDSPGAGANGGLYGGGGGGGNTIGTGAGGVIVITYTQLVSGPTLEQTMRHGKWLVDGTKNAFTF